MMIWLVCLSLSLAFAMGWWLCKRKTVLITAVLWLAFPLYNTWILANCPGDCSIRIDLLLVAPVLFIFSVLAIVAITRQLFRKK